MGDAGKLFVPCIISLQHPIHGRVGVLFLCFKSCGFACDHPSLLHLFKLCTVALNMSRNTVAMVEGAASLHCNTGKLEIGFANSTSSRDSVYFTDCFFVLTTMQCCCHFDHRQHIATLTGRDCTTLIFKKKLNVGQQKPLLRLECRAIFNTKWRHCRKHLICIILAAVDRRVRSHCPDWSKRMSWFLCQLARS